MTNNIVYERKNCKQTDESYGHFIMCYEDSFGPLEMEVTKEISKVVVNLRWTCYRQKKFNPRMYLISLTRCRDYLVRLLIGLS